MFAFTLLLALCAALAAAAAPRGNAREPVRIGVTGNTGDRYIRTGLELLGGFDTSRYSLAFEIMEEDEAGAAVRRGEIAGYLRVPEGFVEGLLDGSRVPLTFVSAGGAGISADLTKEIASAVSGILLETENAMYGVQRYSYDTDPSRDWYAESMILFDRYVSAVLDRSELFGVETVGVTGSLSLAGSLFCGILTALMMIWCMGAAPYFTRRSRSLGEILPPLGVSDLAQTVCEYVPFLIMTAAGAAFIAAAALVFAGRSGLYIPEIAERGAGAAAFAGSVIPAALVISAMSFFLYEAARGASSGPLLQFFNAAAEGFAAGCFYPASFLPGAVRAFGSVLPAGAALRCVCGILNGSPSAKDAAAAAAWAALFIALSALMRRIRREGSL